jgi:hypothetical protein
MNYAIIALLLISISLNFMILFSGRCIAEEREELGEEEPHIHNAAVEATAEAVQDFAVTRSRRSKLEQRRAAREAERTQRRKLEEWSE